MHYRYRFLLPLLAILFAGCSTTPPSRFYLLTPESVQKLSPEASSLVVGVGPVRLAAYLERPQIVARKDANLLKVKEFDRWGGSLEGNISWVIAENISHAIGSDAVVTFPWERAMRPDYQVAIDIRQFDPVGEKQLRLSAQWRILSDDASRLAAIGKSDLTETMTGTGLTAQVAAQSRALARLSDEIAARIGTLVSGR